MIFRLFLACSFVLLARPQDIFPVLDPLRPALVITGITTIALLFFGRREDLNAAVSMAESKRYLLFFFIMMLGIPFAYHKGLAFEGIFRGYIVNVLFFILVVSQITSLHRLKSLVWVICLSTVTYGVLGGLLRIGASEEGRFQVSGGVFDANDTAYVLLSLFPLCLYFVRFHEGLIKKLVSIVGICGAIATIALTGSRGGILGFAAMLLLLFLTRSGGIGKGHKALLVLVLIATWFVMKDRIDVDRYMTLTDLSSDYNFSEDEGGRMKLWKEAIGLTVANPITGVGVNCYAFANDVSRRLSGESYFRWEAVHNSYLQIATEVGLIGFAIFMLIIVRTTVTFFAMSKMVPQPQFRESKEISVLGGLMLLGFVGLLVSGFFLSQGYSIFFTLYFSLAAASARLQASKTLTGIDPVREVGNSPGRYGGGRIPAAFDR